MVRKQLGQHFLTAQHVIARIIHTADIQPHDWVIEIGPGKGALTTWLAQDAQQLIAIEYDSELVARLRQRFASHNHVHVIQADARQICYAELLASFPEHPCRGKIVANLPYYAAVPIMRRIFHDAELLHTCTLMFQQEVAERLSAVPGTKAYGVLSVLAQYHCTVRYEFSVPPTAFSPRPKVDSAVVTLDFQERPAVDVVDPKHFFHLVQCAFRTRRKTLKNALHKSAPQEFPLEALMDAFQECGFSEHIRGEELSLKEFAQLSNFLKTLATT